MQAFPACQPYPDKHDLLRTSPQRNSHLEIVGATIQMLLGGRNGELKKAADESEIMQLLQGKTAKETFIHQAMVNPEFLGLSGGGAILRTS